MRPLSTIEVHDGKRYNTDTATLLAGNDYWDGHNFERGGTNCFLFSTPKGAYFSQHRSQWEGSNDGALEPLTQAQAIDLFEDLREKRVPFEEAFPGATVEDA
jgi:hypothetical protein